MNQVKRQAERIYYVDFLKCVGLMLIFLAHCSPPSLLFGIRTFDVPLMVILSSVLAALKYDQTKHTPIRYIIHRVKRLVVPVWIFLTAYFLLYFLLTGTTFSFKYYLSSFLLTRYGIGYVWIILIYLYNAVLIPLFSKLKPTRIAIISVLAIYILYEVACFYNIGTSSPVVSTLFYIIPYGCVTFLGYNYEKITEKKKKSILFIAFVIFAVLAVAMWFRTGSLQSPQKAKYPPTLYFLSYGVFASCFLLLLCQNIQLRIYKLKLVQYISSHSLWIYLWHILVLQAYSFFSLPKIWYVKFAVVMCGSILTTFIVNKILDIVEKKRTYTFIKYLRG